MKRADGVNAVMATSSVPSPFRRGSTAKTRTPPSTTAFSRSPSTRLGRISREDGRSKSNKRVGTACGGQNSPPHATRCPLFQVLVDQRSHLEHRDLLLAAET